MLGLNLRASFCAGSQQGKFLFHLVAPNDDDRSLPPCAIPSHPNHLLQSPKTFAPLFRQQAPLPSADSICVTIASSSKFFRQPLSNAMVVFTTPLRIVDRTAPDQEFPELIKVYDVARGHNADGGAGSALCLSMTSRRCGRCATFAAIIRKEEKS